MVQEFSSSLSAQFFGKTACMNFLRQLSFVRIFSSSFIEGNGAIVTPAGLFFNEPSQSCVIANLQQEPNTSVNTIFTHYRPQRICFARAEHIILPVG